MAEPHGQGEARNVTEYITTEVENVAGAQDKPSLMTLPQEIRDEILELSFSGNIVNVTHFFRLKKTLVNDGNGGLLAANKQLRSEAFKLYYKHTIFYAKSGGALVGWFRELPESYRVLIEKMCFDCGGSLDQNPARCLMGLVGKNEDMWRKEQRAWEAAQEERCSRRRSYPDCLPLAHFPSSLLPTSLPSQTTTTPHK